MRAAQKGDGFSLSLWYGGQPRHLRFVPPLMHVKCVQKVIQLSLVGKVHSILFTSAHLNLYITKGEDLVLNYHRTEWVK